MSAMKSTVSLLAISIAACFAASCATTSTTEPTALISEPTTGEAAARPEAATPTAAEADAFVARAERELGEFSVISSRAQWVNATYITPDTDALAAHFGTIGTEMGVRFANEAARYADVPGLSYDTRRKLNMLRSALTLPAPTTAGAAAELNLHRPLLAIWPRPRHDGWASAHRQRDRSAHGHGPRPRPAARDVDELERQCRRSDAAPIYAHGRNRQRRRARARLP